MPKPPELSHLPDLTQTELISTTQLPLQRARQWMSRLKVGQKIAVGYLMALGLAVVGITTGLSVGNTYRQQAKIIREQTLEDIALLQRLQTNLLHARIHQQHLITLSLDPTDLPSHGETFNRYADRFQRAWFEFLNTYEIDGPQVSELEREQFQQVIDLHNRSVRTYFQETRQLLNRLMLEDPTAAIWDMQDQIMAVEAGATMDDLEQFSQALDTLLATALEKGEFAETMLLEAERASTVLVGISILLSGAIAVVMAIYISRAISRPLRQVTAIAKRAAEESDFSLQAPITTRDEIGTLAMSLNRLIHQVDHLLEDLQTSTAQQLIASEKMSSLGQMVAGVAHEINNPVNFIYGNTLHANDYIQDLLELVYLYQAEIPEPPSVIQDKIEEIDLQFLQDDLPKIIQSMKLGADRTRQIVLSLRNFSRVDESRPHPVDLHDCLDSTLLILHNRLKRGIDLQRHYDPVPAIEGYTGSLYQVFMNLVSNAIDALTDHPPATGMPTITISTQQQGDRVLICIADNGPGIDPVDLPHIFDTFFTTKPTGKGTGLGLSICRQIVEDKHGGKLSCVSTLGQGSEFHIGLPIQQAIATPLPEASPLQSVPKD
jgi:two-component system NtrC family sensor kinase